MPCIASAADDSYGIDVEQHGRSARVVAGFRIENRRMTERKLPYMDVLRMFVQEKSEISGRAVGRSNGQEHRLDG